MTDAPYSVLFSIGYAQRSLDELVSLLSTHHVERLVDVRELPRSRRPGFSKGPLSAALAARDIEYVHLRSAGNPFRSHSGSSVEVLARYAEHLDAHPEILTELEAAVRGRRAALLCLEADVTDCHRGVLLDRLSRRTERLVCSTSDSSVPQHL